MPHKKGKLVARQLELFGVAVGAKPGGYKTLKPSKPGTLANQVAQTA